jgi:four helix bundle protein
VISDTRKANSESKSVNSDSPQEYIPGYKKLLAFRKANELAHLIYAITNSFPKTELFGLTSQLRRAALSVPVNIVEGYSRNSNKEFHRFLSISLGSLAEVEYFTEFALEEGILGKAANDKIKELKNEVGSLIWRLYKSQE